VAAVPSAVMERLRRFQRRGDPHADRMADEIIDTLGIDLDTEAGIDETERLMRGLSAWQPEQGSPQVPHAVARQITAFVMDENALPGWYRPDVHGASVKRAQTLFQKRRLTSMLILGCASLPQCYSHHEVAASLHGTGLLLSEVRKRLRHTSAFVNGVMAPGALQPNGTGPAWARKIRLMHGMMRKLTVYQMRDRAILDRRAPTQVTALLARDWRRDTGEVPIDQVELCFVLLTFSLIVLEGWESLGLTLKNSARNDYAFTWAIVGHMLGIEDELLTRDPDTACQEAQELFDGIKAIEWMDEQHRPEVRESGRMLAAVLLVVLMEVMERHARNRIPLPRFLDGFKLWVARSLPRTLVRRLVGAPTAGDLWIDPARLRQRIIHWILIKWVGLPKMLSSAAEQSETGLWCEYGEDLEQACAYMPPSRSS